MNLGATLVVLVVMAGLLLPFPGIWGWGSSLLPDSPAPDEIPPAAPMAANPLQSEALFRADPEVSARGADALARIQYPWRERLPGWEIAFLDAHDGAYGYTLTRELRIEIFVRPDQSDELLAHVVAHELGHAVDVTLNDADDRARWQQARQIEDEPWWPNNRASDFATGAGDFAESFAAWQVGADSFRSRLGGPPTGDQLALIEELSN
ncbi:MAG: hypothetical protein AAF467_16330 [Actinomycetota bacterium]